MVSDRRPEPSPDPDPEAVDADPAGDGSTGGGDGGAGDRESAYELLQRGQALIRGRHHAQAAVVLERAAALEPRKGSILEPLGRAYFHSGLVDLAAATFEALLEVDPASGYGHFALGQVLKRRGDVRAARTHLRLAVALDPASRLYRGALDRLPPEPVAADDDEGTARGTDPSADPGDPARRE